MPRRGSSESLSIAWKRLNELWKNDLNTKISQSLNLIEKSIIDSNPVVCWSGGKDSTVALHLSLKIDPNIPVIFVDSGLEHPLTYSYIDYLANELNLNLLVKKANQSFWEVGEKYGWPIFGKSVASNVERAVRSGNIRQQLSHLENILSRSGARISARCAKYLREDPSKEIERNLCTTLKIVGLRADESRHRVRLWADYGDLYYIKRYYGRNKGIWKVNPIVTWTERDVWEYHEKYKLKFCQIYKLGYPRNGCWSCAMGIFRGQLSRLKKYDIKFYEMLYDSKMGLELLRLKKILLKEKSKLGVNIKNSF